MARAAELLYENSTRHCPPSHSADRDDVAGVPALVSTSTLDERLRVAQAATQNPGSIAMLVVSIDYFDIVTARQGHEVAHEVLVVAEARIREAVRPADPICEHGDDGFSILWAPKPGAPDVAEIAQRIAHKFSEPVVTSSGHLPVTVSIGIAGLHEGAAANASTLARRARSAITHARRSGRSHIVFFDGFAEEEALASYETGRQLHDAVRDGQIDVAYQPIFSLHSGQTIGVEALARWNSHVLGAVDPMTFIPIAEENGLMGELGRVVIDHAVSQGSSWTESNQADQPNPLVTVNLSNRQLIDPDLVPLLQQTLATHSLNPRSLCVEISESVLMSDVAASMTILGHLKDLGLVLAVDDFGTGYSSLSYLHKLPVDILKIDQSFVQSIYNRDDRVVTKAIIDLAHTLGMTTVAEGVETRLQVEVLHALDCDMAQGFYLQEPVTASQVDFCKIDFDAPSPVDEPTTGSHGLSSALPATMGSFARR